MFVYVCHMEGLDTKPIYTTEVQLSVLCTIPTYTSSFHILHHVVMDILAFAYESFMINNMYVTKSMQLPCNIYSLFRMIPENCPLHNANANLYLYYISF